MKQELTTIKEKIIPTLRAHGVQRAGVFGSYARGTQSQDSDIDILIDYGTNSRSLLDLVKLENILVDMLGLDVDLLTYRSINPLLKDLILKDEVKII